MAKFRRRPAHQSSRDDENPRGHRGQDTNYQPVPKRRKKLEIHPRNETQRQYLDAIDDHDITFGMGSAGTGKTYLAALKAVEALSEGHVEKIVISRPAVTAGGEDLGFLPGFIKDKMDPYLQPIFDAFRTYWSPLTIERYMADAVIEIVPLAYMRGRSFSNAFVMVDEAQNATTENMLMLLTRLGEGSKIVVTGDPMQKDLDKNSCLDVAEKYLRNVDEIAFVRFSENDVVRHPTVRKILKNWPNGLID